ncbi:MAG: hypothetical protein ACK4XK_11430 [Casimicrobiaceae bacterium]
MPVVVGWCCGDSIEIEPLPAPECGIKRCTGLMPQMISVDEFLPELQFAATNAPEDFLRFSVLAAAGDVAERTGLVRRTILVPVYGGVSVYPWAGGEDERPVALMGWELYDRHGNILSRLDPEFRRGYADLSFVVRELPDRSVEVSGAPCPCGHLRLFYSVAPARTACQMDSLFFHDWQPAVHAGAMARVYATPGSAASPYPFFQPTVAREYQRIFHEEIAKIMGLHDYRRKQTGGMQSILPEQFSEVGY